jgi:AraC-like DNA-binding protein
MMFEKSRVDGSFGRKFGCLMGVVREQEPRIKPETLSVAVQDHKQNPGRGPCAFGFAMSKVPAKRWNTRADLYECLARARSVLDEQFREPLCLSDLSAHAGVSQFHFQRLFKEFFGVSPNERQRSLRLQAAKELIEKGMSVTEACFDVGFQSPSSFTRFFKREFGVSPVSLRTAKVE